MEGYNLFFIYIQTLAVIAILAILLFLRKVILKQGLVSRSLNLILLSVRFAIPPPQEMNVQQLREKIALTEQFYTHLFTISDKWWRVLFYGRPTFALEVTVPHVGEEISFYVAVPRRLKLAVEKVIQGIFPDSMVEESRDYNIFNPTGTVVASHVLLKTNSYYPVRTYQKLEGDPMKELTNIFTKLAKVGEGAALQIVARPAAPKWRRKLKERAKILYGTKKPNHVILGVLETIFETFGSISSPPSPSQQNKQPELKKITPLEEELVRTLEGKASKALFATNIRLVASAASKERAGAILESLEIAFAQFTDPSANSFKVERAEGRALQDLVFSFSFRSLQENKKSILGTEELTSVFHFANVPLETPKVKMVKAREASPPADLPLDGLLLGYNIFRGEKSDIKILDEDRRRHLYIMGQTGTGKSVLLENMIVQDIESGKGVCVIDPHGEMVQRIAGFIPRHRFQDVIYFDPGDTERPMGLNMLEYDFMFPEQKTFIVNELFGIFQKLYGAIPEALGPMFEQYFRNATMLVMDDPSSGNTLLEISRVMADKDFRDLKISRAKNIVVKNFWTQVAEKAGGEGELRNMVPYITSKFDVFLANEIMRPIIAQEKSAFNFREIMDNQRILLVNLSKGRLGDINSSLIGLVVVGKILMAAFSRVDVPEEKRRDFYLYIDEFQNVTTDSIATILSEARKYKLDLTISHQFISQLKEEIKKAVFGNVGSMATFRIGSDDAEFMSKQYKPIFSEQDLLNIDNFNCYVKLLIRGATSSPFSMKTYPPEKGNREVYETVKEISRAKYGRPREEIEGEIIKKYPPSMEVGLP